VHQCSLSDCLLASLIMAELPQEWKYVAGCRAFFTCLVMVAAILVVMALKGTTVYSGDTFPLGPNGECQIIIYPYDINQKEVSLINFKLSSNENIVTAEGKAEVHLLTGAIESRAGLNTDEECGILVFDVNTTSKPEETRIKHKNNGELLELPQYCAQDIDWRENWGFREGTFQEMLLVAGVVVWAGLRLQGLLLEYLQLKKFLGGGCGITSVKFGIYLIFNLAPTIMLRPFTSMDLHEDCPQVITMFFNNYVQGALAAFGFLMLIDTFILLYLVKEMEAEADVGVCSALCSIFTFFFYASYSTASGREKKKPSDDLMSLAYLLVPAVPLLMMFLAVIVKIVEMTNIDWTLCFGFRLQIPWPSYELGFKVSVFNALMVLINALDLLGTVSQFVKCKHCCKRKMQSES
jgi:hypothetical protein